MSFSTIFVLSKFTASIFQIIHIQNKTLNPCVNGQWRSWMKAGLNLSPASFYFLKTSKKLGHRMTKERHGKAVWKPGITETAKPHKGNLQCSLEPKAAGANVLTHVGLWPMTIKLKPSWKLEISKSAWIKPWLVISKSVFSSDLTFDMTSVY